MTHRFRGCCSTSQCLNHGVQADADNVCLRPSRLLGCFLQQSSLLKRDPECKRVSFRACSVDHGTTFSSADSFELVVEYGACTTSVSPSGNDSEWGDEMSQCAEERKTRKQRETVEGLAAKLVVEKPEVGSPVEVIDALADLLIDMAANRNTAR